jgi:hypothetical protein
VTTAQRFSKPVVAAFDKAKIIGVRSGAEHRYTGVWVVVVGGRVFARSWSDKPTGWYRSFVEEPRGTIQIPKEREVRVRAKKVRGERLLDTIENFIAYLDLHGRGQRDESAASHMSQLDRPRQRSYFDEFLRQCERRHQEQQCDE